MEHRFRHTAFAALALLAPACMDYGPLDEESFHAGGRGVFIVSEGNLGGENASLSYYDPATRRLENEVFARANGMKLGDVAQSMTLHGGRGWIAVNNSGVVYAIDPSTFRVKGLIEGVVSPRYILFPNDTTAYVTDLYDAHITVVDTRTNRIRRKIAMNGHRSTEQMVAWGGRVYVNCWSYDDKILAVDAARDELVDSLTVGPQPASLVVDRRGKLWTLTDGNTPGARAALYRIDAATLSVEQVFLFPPESRPVELTLNGGRDTLYYIAGDVWRMPVAADRLPETPFLPYAGTTYYGLGVDPRTSEVYVADAIDYAQHGAVYRFTPKGACIDTLRVGINPGAFAFE